MPASPPATRGLYGWYNVPSRPRTFWRPPARRWRSIPTWPKPTPPAAVALANTDRRSEAVEAFERALEPRSATISMPSWLMRAFSSRKAKLSEPRNSSFGQWNASPTIARRRCCSARWSSRDSNRHEEGREICPARPQARRRSAARASRKFPACPARRLGPRRHGRQGKGVGLAEPRAWPSTRTIQIRSIMRPALMRSSASRNRPSGCSRSGREAPAANITAGSRPMGISILSAIIRVIRLCSKQ